MHDELHAGARQWGPSMPIGKMLDAHLMCAVGANKVDFLKATLA